LKRLDFGEVPSSGSSFIMVMKAADFWYLLDHSQLEWPDRS
jgi:hypothetical protein